MLETIHTVLEYAGVASTAGLAAKAGYAAYIAPSHPDRTFGEELARPAFWPRAGIAAALATGAYILAERQGFIAPPETLETLLAAGGAAGVAGLAAVAGDAIINQTLDRTGALLRGMQKGNTYASSLDVIQKARAGVSRISYGLAPAASILAGSAYAQDLAPYAFTTIGAGAAGYLAGNVMSRAITFLGDVYASFMDLHGVGRFSAAYDKEVSERNGKPIFKLGMAGAAIGAIWNASSLII